MTTMNDDQNSKQETLPPLSPAEEAVRIAQSTWGAAMERCMALHRAAVAKLDLSRNLALRDMLEVPGSQPEQTPSDAGALLLARMEQRVLLLAQALQKHGLLRILD